MKSNTRIAEFPRLHPSNEKELLYPLSILQILRILALSSLKVLVAVLYNKE